MKTYKQFIEMAVNVGDMSLDLHTEKRQKAYFEHSKNLPIHASISPDVKLHKVETAGRVTYHTNDHKDSKTLHRADFENHKPTDVLPFPHQEQVSVERIHTDKLPKHYAETATYNHIKESNVPLISSTHQTPSGHKLWRGLAKRALDNNMHVYYHDGSALHKSNIYNLDSHLSSYFDPGTNYDSSGNLINPSNYEHRHMIISKKGLS